MQESVARIASAALSCVVLASALPASATVRHEAVVGGYPGGAFLPTGVYISPLAAPGSKFFRLPTGLRADGTADANAATATALSPDGKTLLILSSGYNTNFKTPSGTPITQVVPDPTTGAPSSTTTRKTEWAFVYDVSKGDPRQVQRFSIPDTYDGIVWSPDGAKFFVSAGIDDRILVFAATGSAVAPFAASYPSIFLGHNDSETAPFPTYDGGVLKNTPARAITTGAVAAGIALSADGKTMAVANMENDSLSIVDVAGRKPTGEVFFAKPGSGQRHGEYPYGVAIASDASGAAKTAYVSSLRDDE